MRRAFMQTYVKDRQEAIKAYQKAFDAVIGYNETLPDGTLIHLELEIDGNVVAVGEIEDNGDAEVTGNTMQFCLHYKPDEEAKVRQAYEVLKEGAKINYDLGPCIFSPLMTDLVDRFGVRWCIFVEGK